MYGFSVAVVFFMIWLSSKYHPPFYDGRAVLFITMDVMERVGKKENKK